MLIVFPNTSWEAIKFMADCWERIFRTSFNCAFWKSIEIVLVSSRDKYPSMLVKSSAPALGRWFHHHAQINKNINIFFIFFRYFVILSRTLLAKPLNARFPKLTSCSGTRRRFQYFESTVEDRKSTTLN